MFLKNFALNVNKFWSIGFFAEVRIESFPPGTALSCFLIAWILFSFVILSGKYLLWQNFLESTLEAFETIVYSDFDKLLVLETDDLW